jgi:hypothetical protein
MLIGDLGQRAGMSRDVTVVNQVHQIKSNLFHFFTFSVAT